MLSIDDILITCAAGMLVSGYLMVGQKALVTAIRLYGVQSLLLGIVAAAMACRSRATNCSSPRPSRSRSRRS